MFSAPTRIAPAASIRCDQASRHAPPASRPRLIIDPARVGRPGHVEQVLHGERHARRAVRQHRCTRPVPSPARPPRSVNAPSSPPSCCSIRVQRRPRTTSVAPITGQPVTSRGESRRRSATLFPRSCAKNTGAGFGLIRQAAGSVSNVAACAMITRKLNATTPGPATPVPASGRSSVRSRPADERFAGPDFGRRRRAIAGEIPAPAAADARYPGRRRRLLPPRGSRGTAHRSSATVPNVERRRHLRQQRPDGGGRHRPKPRLRSPPRSCACSHPGRAGRPAANSRYAGLRAPLRAMKRPPSAVTWPFSGNPGHMPADAKQRRLVRRRRRIGAAAGGSRLARWRQPSVACLPGAAVSARARQPPLGPRRTDQHHSPTGNPSAPMPAGHGPSRHVAQG